jgi:hypothetical protein
MTERDTGSAVAGDLLGRIEAEHQAAVRSARMAIQHAIACGALLIEARLRVEHGEWSKWVETHLTLSLRQAEKYMRIARWCPAPDSTQESNLTIEQALAAIREPKGRSEPAPAGTVSFAKKQQRQKAVERLAAHLQKVAGTFGAGVVVEAQNRYQVPESALLRDEIARQEEETQSAPAPAPVLRMLPNSTPAIDGVEQAALRLSPADLDELIARLLEHQQRLT